ncbi:PREDICTED: ras-related protein Rab-26 isoform X3 [Condylura cristata]|uniref:ras-related protein Rab-26 isoform X3 n=1 Tax=Condylura cristata TaxID=143302 RepID=UPI000642E685|nr:PREDICTED: ras-related protein Rab-26 isoform X3 [Condylura cristata]
MQECPRQPARPQEALRWLCSGGAALVGAGDKALLELTLFQNKVLDVDGTKVKLQIWDTAGQERFRSVTHAYYRDAHALLLLYDVTSRASFDNTKVSGRPLPLAAGRWHAIRLPPFTRVGWVWARRGPQLAHCPQAWLAEIQEHAQHDVVLMLLGNKVDSSQGRAVKREDGEKLAREYGLPFMETSAKTGLNVDLAFTAIAKELKQRSLKTPSQPDFQLHDYIERAGRGGSCCRP